MHSVHLDFLSIPVYDPEPVLLVETLEHGKLVPDVSNFTAPLCALIYNLPIHFSEAIHVPIL